MGTPPMKCSYACNSPDHVLSRRQFLGATAAAGIGAGFSSFTRPAVAAELARKLRQALVIWLAGGASQLEAWDPKPKTETGGPFRSIETSVPGVQISELLPRTAMQMHRLALLHSINTNENDHGKGTYLMHTGRPQTPATVYPHLGSVMARWLTEAGNPPWRLPVGARQKEKIRKIGGVFSGRIPLRGSDSHCPIDKNARRIDPHKYQLWRHTKRATDGLQTTITLGSVNHDGQAFSLGLSLEMCLPRLQQDEHLPDQIEAYVHQAGLEVQRRLFQVLIEKADQELALQHRHGKGGAGIQRRGTRPFTFQTIFGEVTVQRSRISHNHD